MIYVMMKKKPQMNIKHNKCLPINGKHLYYVKYLNNIVLTLSL